MTDHPEATWTPGDPLHARGPWTRALVQVIEHTDAWTDAASWPEPFAGDDLDLDYELEEA